MFFHPSRRAPGSDPVLCLCGPLAFQLQHDLFKTLEGTAFGWLSELLLAFSSGNIATFNQVMAAQQARQPTLAAHAAFLAQKIRLMALVELVFRRRADDRTLTLADVAAHCQIDPLAVELLLMKAMSLKLVEGVIDQVPAALPFYQ